MSDSKPKITLQQFGFQDSSYERPNQKWVCGRLSEGCPCHLGPNNKGECISSFECSPNKKGDRWECTRPANRGGKCEQGPSPDGTCCNAIPKCQPVRSIRAKRAAFVWWCVALTAGILAIMLFSNSRMDFIQPGELSHAHGQIMKNADGEKTAQACAQCHSAAQHSFKVGVDEDGDGIDDEGVFKTVTEISSPNHWIASAIVSEKTLSANERCLSCHQNHPAFKGDAFASHPHSVNPALLGQTSNDPSADQGATGAKDGKDAKAEKKDGKTSDKKAASAPSRWKFAWLGPGVPKTATNQLACSTCHKEHRGAMHNLAAMDNQSCQACHTQKFSSFSSGHPEFSSFPYHRRTRIKFDHANHEKTYFKGKAFNCAQCHRVDAASQHMNVRSFEQACSECHGDSLRKFERVQDGVPVIRLPGMDLETLTEFTQTDAKNPWLGHWPERADYGMDMPRLTPFMILLLRADDEVAAALDSFPEKFDLGDLTEATDEQKKAAVRIGWGVKELLYELSRNGQEAMRVRLAKVLGVELNNDVLANLTGQISAEVINDANKLWFPKLMTNVPMYRDIPKVPGIVEKVKKDFADKNIDREPTAKEIAEAGGIPVSVVQVVIDGKGMPGRPALKPPPPPKPKDPPKPKPSDDDLFGEDPPADDLFNQDPPDEPVDDALFEDDKPKKPVSDDLFAEDPPAEKKPDDGLFEDDPPAKSDPDDGLFDDDGGDAKPKAGDDDLFGGDDLFDDDGGSPEPVKDEPKPIKQETVKPLPIEQRVPGGGWYIDDRKTGFAVRYAPMGHGNVFLKQWLTSTSDTSSVQNANHAKAIQAVFSSISTTSGALCMKCHSVDGTSNATRMVNWNARTPSAEERGFVKFSHRPHLNIAEMRDCRSCHQIEPADVMARYKDIDPHGASTGKPGFKFMTKASCNNCHQPKLAGDSCTKCHNYHIGKPPRWWNRQIPPAGVAIDPKKKRSDQGSQGE